MTASSRICGRRQHAHRTRYRSLGLGLLLLLLLLMLGRQLTPAARAQEATPTTAPAAALSRYAPYLLPACGAAPANGAVRVTFLGTTTLLFDDGTTSILIDGFFTRPSLDVLLSGSIATDPAAVAAVLDRAAIDRVDAIFVAHSHWDHAMDVATVAQETGAHLYSSESTLNIARGGGLAEDQMSRFAPGDPVGIGAFQVTVIPSRHSPAQPGVNDDLGDTIDAPLAPPAPVTAFVEGGAFDFLIEHGENSVLVKPSANWVDGALDDVRADVLFLGTATLGQQDHAFRDAFYAEAVAAVQPGLVVPIHWDDFFLPLSEDLVPLDSGDLVASFDDLIPRLDVDGIAFGLMQGYQSTVLFGDCSLLVSPSPAGAPMDATPTTITGTVIFPGGTAAGPPATMTVRLEDVSRADAPASILASITLDDVPVPPAAGDHVTFTLPVESFDAHARYTVRVHIDRDGDGQVSKGDLITTSHVPVLTNGGGTEVQVPVEIV